MITRTDMDEIPTSTIIDAQTQSFGSGSSTFSMFKGELFRARKRRMTWGMFSVIGAIAALLYGGFTVAHFVNPDNQSYIDALRPDRIVDNGLGLMTIVISILVVVFASSLVGSEYGWNTMRSLVARSRTRNAMLTSKWATAGLFSLFMVGAAVAFTVLAATIGTLVIGEGFGIDLAVLGDATSAGGRLLAGTFPYAGLAMMLAVVARSNTAGIALGIGLQLLEPLVFGLLGALNDVFEKIAKGGLFYNVDRVLSYGTEDSVVTAQQAINSGLVLGAWLVAFIGISYIVFNRRDIVSG